MKKILSIIGILAILWLPTSTMACVAGIKYEKTVGSFKAMMSYDAYRLNPDQNVRFHFDLSNISSRHYGPGNPIDYDFVEVSLLKEKEILIQTAIPRINYGETAFNYTLPNKHDTYIMTANYVKDNTSIANLALPVRVGRGNLWLRLFSGGNAYSNLLEDVTISRQ